MAVFLWPPVSVTTLPPLGGATSANQVLEIAALNSIDGKLSSQATDAKQDTGNASLASIDAKNPALVGGKVPVDTGLAQALTDTQLRATPVPVSGTVTANAGTNLNTSALALEATQLLVKAKTDNLDVALSTVAKDATLTANGVLLGSVTETAPVSDTASSGLNGRLQRIAQRLTSLIALFPTSLGSKAAASSFAVTSSTEDTALMGSLTETAPATDTASSGHNGRLQRIAQRITSLIAIFPTALGQGTMATSFKVVVASDQSSIPTTSTSASVAGTITQGQITVGTTAVRLTVAGTAPNAARKKLMFAAMPANTGTLYYGGSTVTTATGQPIIGPDLRIFDFDAGDYYIISDTAAQLCSVIEKV